MSVNPVNSSIATFVQRVASGGTSQSQPSAMASAVQEATETPDVTLKEAQKGDKIAIRKLQQEQQAKQQQSAHAKAPEPGKGSHIDSDA
jgi:hypothetical protein